MPVSTGATATEANLNDTTPAAPAGALNGRWQAGAPYADPNNSAAQVRDISVYCPRAGGVNEQTATYTALATDDGLLLVFNSASALTLHLPAAPPTGPALNPWRVWVANIGLGVLTIDPNGLNIDGAGTSITLNQFNGLYITTDGANYFSSRGAGGSGGTVTSVALAAPPEFTVSGSPVTTAGTITLGKANESANTVAAGPTSGGAAPWAFRALVMADLPIDVVTSVVGITIDGAGSTPTTGVKGFIQAPWSGTIVGWFAIADQVGSISVDVDKHASSAPPAAPAIPNTSTDKISASAPIALSSAQSASGGATAVSTWTTAVAAWDVFQFNVTSVSTLHRVTIGIIVQRT